MIKSLPRMTAGSTAVALLLAVVAAGGCSGASEEPPASVDDATSTAQASGTSVDVGRESDPAAELGALRTVTAEGRLAGAMDPQGLSFGTSGTVTEVLVEAGQPVAEGQVLARIDSGPLDLAVADARAALAQARANLNRLETGATLETARLDIERAKNQLWGHQAQRDAICGAYEQGQKEGGFAKVAAPSSADCDSAQASVQAAEQGVQIAQAQEAAAAAAADADLASARAAAERARLALEQALANRAESELVAPLSGTVTQVHLMPGVVASPGARVITLQPEGMLQFVTDNLSERDVAVIEPGSIASITLTAFPDSAMDAVVARISETGSVSAEGVVVFEVHLYMTEDLGLPLRAGMTGRAEIEALEVARGAGGAP